MNNVFTKLAEPFYADELEWKIQAWNNKNRLEATKAMVVTYIDARAVQRRLDEAVGPENWSVKYVPGPDGGITCQLSLRIGNEWIVKEDGAEKTTVEPVKGGYSSAFRRAAVVWGLGRYLYAAPTYWVDLDKPGGRPKYPNNLPGPIMPKEFYPADADSQGHRPKATKPADQKALDAWKTLAEKALNAGIGVTEPAPGISVEELRKTYEDLAKQIKALETVASTKKEAATQAKKEAVSQPKKEETAAPANTPLPVQPEPTGELTLEEAVTMKVPSGVGVPEKVVGTTLGDAKKDTRMGILVVRFLAGEIPNMKGAKFEPTDAAQDRLKKAAKMVLEAA